MHKYTKRGPSACHAIKNHSVALPTNIGLSNVLYCKIKQAAGFLALSSIRNRVQVLNNLYEVFAGSKLFVKGPIFRKTTTGALFNYEQLRAVVGILQPRYYSARIGQPFHLVSPSPFPIFVALNFFCMAFSFIICTRFPGFFLQGGH